jgi:ADP-heptose:LPS heptosyltransferase
MAILWTLRRRRLDLAILATGAQDVRGERFAKQVSPLRIVASDSPGPGQHEVERAFTAARRLGIEGPIPPLRILPNAVALASAGKAIRQAGLKRPLIGVHISARRPAQRWSARQFAQLTDAMRERFNADTLLFWSPGAENHPQHPGDDAKAKELMGTVRNSTALLPYPTAELPTLIAGFAQCDAVVCSDGGAMHIAAALGKPIACFFGDSPVERWRPWGVRHVVLKAPSCKVEDVTVGQALDAIGGLLRD